MRKHLFRGKRTDNNEWMYGVPVEVEPYFEMYYFNFEEYEMEHHLVAPETIGQYTGLTDKNGKKIFEGDIVKDFIPFNFTIDGEKEFEENVYVIEYSSKSGGFKPFCESDHYGDSIIEECEVIGNIHDNPELLKGGAKNDR